MSPLLVTRVHKNGDPYDGVFRHICSQLDASAMPSPGGDTGLVEAFNRPDFYTAYKPYRFGFTAGQFERWWTPTDTHRAHFKGCVVRQFLVPPGTFKLGDEQVCFLMEKATHVD